MRNDLTIGALVAVGAHAALLLYSNSPRLPVAPPPKEPEEVITLTPRAVEPPEMERAIGDPEPKKEIVEAPPRLPDAPRPITDADFKTPVRPYPIGFVPNRGSITIPAQRPNVGEGGGGTGAVFDLRALDRTPVARFQARPEYPFEMKRTGSAGEVLVEFVVAADGSVRDARAVRSSQREFEDAAVRAVSKWTFRPGQKDGRNVPTRMQVPIVFSLNEERG